MAVIIMRSIRLLIKQLRSSYPEILFEGSHEFKWSPLDKTIFYDASSDDTACLLHELAHATLGHSDYTRDIELIEMEAAAWQYAKDQLSPRFNVPLEEEIIQENLDTYRDWLHSRSTCPSCTATGVQTKPETYRCILCMTVWRVNSARTCALRRYKI